jgi:hypothetical protein
MYRPCLLLLLICLGACGGPGAASSAGEGDVPTERISVEAEVRPGLVELRRWREPRQRVVIERAGVAIGPAGGSLVRKLFVEPTRLEDLLFFLRTYAPFRQRSAAGELAFGGGGPVKAGPVEQRMIFEWARKVAAEVESAQSQDSYGLVLAWHRGGGAESCDGLAVYLDGEVHASSCAWPDESRGRLRPESLARLHQWYDQLKPFQQALGVEAGRGRVPVRLTFAGHGPGAASPQDVAALQALATSLHRELAVRRGGAAPPPVAPEAAAKTVVPAEPSPSLLVPPAPPARLPPPQALRPGIRPPPPADEPEPTAL